MKITRFIGALAWLTFLALCVRGRCADWPTFGHDPQRSGWAGQEDTLSLKNVSGLKLLWKTHRAVLSETKEGSPQFVETSTAGILRFAQNDTMQGFAAAC